MLSSHRYRYHPRSPQDQERHRRDAALRAQMSDLERRLEALEKEQMLQFKRMAAMQQTLDDLQRLLQASTTAGTRKPSRE